MPMILDALIRPEFDYEEFDYVVVLQANSSVTKLSDIRANIRQTITQKKDVTFTVTKSTIPPQWRLRLVGEKPEFAFSTNCVKGTTHRQELEQLYRSTGAIFCANIAYLGGNPQSAQLALPVSGQNSGVVIIDPMTSIDVHGEMDYLLAEALHLKVLKTS